MPRRTMSKPLTVYLAGPCKHLEDEGRGYREELTKMLTTVAEWCGKEITVINPTKYFSYAENKHKSNKQVKEFYLNKILNSDLVLVNCNDTDLSPGTAQETQFARDNKIPVIGYGTKNCYPWITEVDCQVVFDSMHEVVDYVRDYYLAS